MILVIAGTKDGRELAEALYQAGFPVMVTVTSQYGRELAVKDGISVQAKPLDYVELLEFITNNHVTAVVDASHPYAELVSRNCLSACRHLNIYYLRYERPEALLPAYDHLYVVNDYQQAAKQAALLGKTIFLTTGSRQLHYFKAEPALSGHRVIARVLPDPQVITECLKIGFTARDIIAMQGPFSHGMNLAMFRECGADVVVSKNSGLIGGTDTKISAAMELSLAIVIIDRPRIRYGNVRSSIQEVLISVGEIKHA